MKQILMLQSEYKQKEQRGATIVGSQKGPKKPCIGLQHVPNLNNNKITNSHFWRLKFHNQI